MKFDKQGFILFINDCLLPSFTLFFEESQAKAPLREAVASSLPFWIEESDNSIVGCIPKDYYLFEEKYILNARQLIRSVKSKLHLSKEEPWEFGQKKYTPTEISSLYLSYILKAVIFQDPLMERYIYENTIVTVPASFVDLAREKTRTAVMNSGIKMGHKEKLLLDEPTAAYYCYLFDNREKVQAELKQKDQTVLVYDLGGGTLDMSLLSIKLKEKKVVVEVIDKSDHILLGGDDFDIRLADYYVDHIRKNLLENPKDLIDDFNEVKREGWFFQPIVAHARDAKEALFTKESTDITTICSKLSFNAEYRMPSVKISRSDYRNIISAFLLDHWKDVMKSQGEGSMLSLRTGDSDIINPLMNLLRSNQYPQIDKLIFSGGMTIIPFVIDRVKEVVNTLSKDDCSVHILPEPFHAVARGAAFFLWAKESGQAVFLNRLTHTYSLKITKPNGEICLYVVADKGCHLPHQGTVEQDFTFCPGMGDLIMELWDGKTTPLDEQTMTIEDDKIKLVGKKKVDLSSLAENQKIPPSTMMVVKLNYEIDEDEILQLGLTLNDEGTREEFAKKGLTGQAAETLIGQINAVLNEAHFQSEKK